MQSMMSITQADAPICITFSGDELYVLLRLLHGKTMPGLDLAPFELDANGFPSEAARRVLAATTNSLVARGVIEPDGLNRAQADALQADGATPRLTLKLPIDVIALIGACAFGEYTLRLTLLSSAGMVNVYLHELRNVGVLHTTPLAGIHKLTGLQGRQGVLEEVSKLLGLEAQPGAAVAPFSVHETALYAARDAAIAGRREDAVGLLVGAGAPASSAEELAGAMVDPRGLGAVGIGFRTSAGTARERHFAFVIGKKACFLLTPSTSATGVYDVQPVSAEQVLKHFQSCLAEAYSAPV